jgi:hypothetical protein
MESLSAYLGRSVSALLIEYPALGDVLTSFGIGCATCASPSCALGDIVQYHYLPEAQQQELMARIAQTIGVEP